MIMTKRNTKEGDNCALRYDFFCSHIPSSVCHLPYMSELFMLGRG
jgi:hypothetical protein